MKTKLLALLTTVFLVSCSGSISTNSSNKPVNSVENISSAPVSSEIPVSSDAPASSNIPSSSSKYKNEVSSDEFFNTYEDNDKNPNRKTYNNMIVVTNMLIGSGTYVINSDDIGQYITIENPFADMIGDVDTSDLSEEQLSQLGDLQDYIKLDKIDIYVSLNYSSFSEYLDSIISPEGAEIHYIHNSSSTKNNLEVVGTFFDENDIFQEYGFTDFTIDLQIDSNNYIREIALFYEDPDSIIEGAMVSYTIKLTPINEK